MTGETPSETLLVISVAFENIRGEREELFRNVAEMKDDSNHSNPGSIEGKKVRAHNSCFIRQLKLVSPCVATDWLMASEHLPPSYSRVLQVCGEWAGCGKAVTQSPSCIRDTPEPCTLV